MTWSRVSSLAPHSGLTVQKAFQGIVMRWNIQAVASSQPSERMASSFHCESREQQPTANDAVATSQPSDANCCFPSIEENRISELVLLHRTMRVVPKCDTAHEPCLPIVPSHHLHLPVDFEGLRDSESIDPNELGTCLHCNLSFLHSTSSKDHRITDCEPSLL